ncbi:unnamed protein product, partial [Mesorhabditis spiculigera]
MASPASSNGDFFSHAHALAAALFDVPAIIRDKVDRPLTIANSASQSSVSSASTCSTAIACPEKATVEIGPETAEALQWLLPFNGSELCIRWRGPVTDLGPIRNFVEYSLPMTLTHDQRIRVIFSPHLPVEMLRPDMFNGFRMRLYPDGHGTDLIR